MGKWGLIGFLVVFIVALALNRTFGADLGLLLGIVFAIGVGFVTHRWDKEEREKK